MKITLKRVKMTKTGKCPKGSKLRRTGKSRRRGCFIRGKK